MKHQVKMIISIIVLFIFFVACSQNQNTAHNHSTIDYTQPYKEEFPRSRNGETNTFFPIKEDHLLMVKGWLSNEEILYVSNVNGNDKVIAYNLYTGEQTILFQTSNTIVQVYANNAYTYFAIESKDLQNNSNVTIINKNGETLFEDILAVDLVEFAWNPYEENELLITKYYPSFTTEVTLLDVQTREQKELHVIPYVQWFSSNEIGYFNWNEEGASLEAPIELYNLQTESKEQLITGALLFTSIENYFMYIQNNDTALTFHFVTPDDHQEVGQLTIPQLSSNAGYVWTPFFDWVQHTNTFFTFKPIKAESILEYKDGYELIAYDVEAGNITTIAHVDYLSPIECSPNGEKCLIGDRLDKMIKVRNGDIVSIVDEN